LKNSTFWPNSQILDKYPNFGQIFKKNKFSLKIQSSAKNKNFAQKFKFWQTILILAKILTLIQNLDFWLKIKFFSKL